MNSAKPLNTKKETGTIGSGEPISTKASDTNARQPGIGGGAGPKLAGNAPLRKIQPDQFFKGIGGTPSQGQPTNVQKVKATGQTSSTDKYGRYQSPIVKLN